MTTAPLSSMLVDHPLHGRRVAFATMHGKQVVLAPPLARAFAIEVLVPSGFDTDRFGTFTGTVARPGTAIETARVKARAAMLHCGTRCAVASEGSFGPHPALPLLPLAAELVVLLDDELGLEILAEDVGGPTNFAGREVASPQEAERVALAVGFPSHHVVVGPPHDPLASIRGIRDPATLRDVVARGLRQQPTVLVTSDMRADHNPTRMQAIARAGQRLAVRAARLCPACRWPGYGVTGTLRGLPCRSCGEPTLLVRGEAWGCQRCPQREQLPRADGVQFAEPGECGACNP